jgi:antitoxin component YwqK of YwqJK toxin-antitoxin module
MRVVNKSLCYKSFDKKIAILLVFIFSSVCLSKELSIYDLTKREGIYYEKATDVPYTGELIIRYTSGKVSTIKNYRKGILHGAYEMYHVDGKLLERGTYKNGKLDGAYESYNDNYDTMHPRDSSINRIPPIPEKKTLIGTMRYREQKVDKKLLKPIRMVY